MYKYYIFFISVFFISCECGRPFLYNHVELREYIPHKTYNTKAEINIIPLEQTTNINNEIVLSDYITIKDDNFTSTKGEGAHISVFYYHRKDTLPCELIEIKENATLDEIYDVRNTSMYDISRKYRDYQFHKKETIRFVVRSILPKEMKKWIKFEQCRCLRLKVHYPDGSSTLFDYTLQRKEK
jgi:hypothetical protein